MSISSDELLCMLFMFENNRMFCIKYAYFLREVRLYSAHSMALSLPSGI